MFSRNLYRILILIVLISVGFTVWPTTEAPDVSTEAWSPEHALKIERFELPNGMRFLLVERPQSTITRLGWVVPSGSSSDPDGKAGLAHLLEHMMFQGSRTIGSEDFDRELKLLEQEDRWVAELDRAGGRSKRAARELLTIRQRLQELTRFGDFSALYTRAGASGLDAITYEDFTLYLVALPAEAIELWFWLESDRLDAPIFRQLERERSVVHEERRYRIEGVPGGRFQERVRKTFWAGTPYADPGLGSPETLDRLRRADLQAFFKQHYQPQRLTAVLVGPHRIDAIRPFAERYFGRLRNAESPELEPTPTDQHKGMKFEFSKRLLRGSGPGRPSGQFLYPTVPHHHQDAPALDLVAALLNGPSGRLYRSLVVEQGLATVAWAVHHPRRLAGSFNLVAEPTKGFPAVEQALEAEIARLLQEPPQVGEFERARQRLFVDHFRRFQDPMTLVKQLLIESALGDSRTPEQRWSKVRIEDVQRVIKTYLQPSQRLAARYDNESAPHASPPHAGSSQASPPPSSREGS